MTRLNLLLHIKGLVLNDKIEAAFDLIRVEFDDYEDITDLFLLQNQYNRSDSNYSEKNRIIRALMNIISHLMNLSNNNLPIAIDKELKIQSILKSPYAFILDRKNIGFFVTHHHESMPFSFDYFLKDDNVKKAYTETDFGLLLTIINPFDEGLIITNITIKTIYFEQIAGRVLRQHGPKGFIEPVELNFLPSTTLGDSVNLLKKGRLYEVLSKNTDRFLLKLGKKADAGFYEMIVSIRVLHQNIPFILESDMIPLSIENIDNQNTMTLHIALKHHDEIAKNILELDNSKWNLIKNQSEDEKGIVYLGQTVVDGKEDKTWKIRKLKKENISKKHGRYSYNIDSNQKSTIVIDLGVPKN
jgi:hypothetical protein